MYLENEIEKVREEIDREVCERIEMASDLEEKHKEVKKLHVGYVILKAHLEELKKELAEDMIKTNESLNVSFLKL